MNNYKLSNKLDKNNTEKLFNEVKSLLKQARNSVVQNINTTMVVSYFEIGKLIVENQQKGKERAQYGKAVLKELSQKLTNGFGKGFSVQNLENMRKFYLSYHQKISSPIMRKSELNKSEQKSQTVSRIFQTPDFKLSWSHYLFLIGIDNKNNKI